MGKSRRFVSDAVALIVGAGAVENAWQPVIRALQPHFHAPLTPESANLLLARVVYLLRWFASIKNEKELNATKALLNQIRASICKELLAAQADGEIKVRPEFAAIVDKLVLSRSRKVMIVNTNWDTVIDDALTRHVSRSYSGDLHPVHIHGSVKNSSLLYLPTEMVREPYRTPEEDAALGTLHGAVMRALDKAKWVVLYGTSLSPLDAELVQTIAAGISSPHVKQVDLIVPDHSFIAQRATVLLDPRYPVKIRGYDPSALHSATDYTPG